MKRKDITNLHGKSSEDLRKMLSEKRRTLAQLVSEKLVKSPKNSRAMRHMRNDIARIATVLTINQAKEKTKK
jgi:ribosomal protein L29